MSPRVVLNGEPRALPDGATVDAAVRTVSTAASGVAVAVNGDVVRRRDWAATALHDGDKVEILTAIQGG